MPDGPVLLVQELTVATLAGAAILEDVSLEVERGEVTAIVGESGSGKTTLALALLGHERKGTRVVGGRALLDGTSVLELSERELRRTRGARIAYVAQDPTAALNPRHRIERQLQEILLVHGESTRSAAARTAALLAEVGLPGDDEFRRRYPFQLSGGQQQRVMIAMALACRPSVVVLDEPTTGLDVTTQARIVELIKHLSRANEAAFVYITHDLAVVDGLADRVAVMYSGKVVEHGRCRDVFGDPAHPYTALLLSSVPSLERRSELVGIPGAAPAPGWRPSGCHFHPRCPLAVELCAKETPAETVLAGGHGVRCWRATERVDVTAGAALAPAHRDGDAALVVEGLQASYGRGRRRREVLHGVSFTLRPGECLAVVGESGSGKTTLGRCVTGLHAADAGTVRIDGVELGATALARTREQLRAMQMIFQNPDRSLNPRETIGRALARPLRLFGVCERSAERAEAQELLERVRLSPRLIDRYPRELSGGERQRVAIARALAARPEIVICDEITSSLDVSIQAAIVSLLDELRADGLALLFITHNLALVNALADSVLVLKGGEVKEYGPCPKVIGTPIDAYTQELVAAVPRLTTATSREA
jgi:peptide/nickel transport system ATP-binding protein